jgi:hypothetical protein
VQKKNGALINNPTMQQNGKNTALCEETWDILAGFFACAYCSASNKFLNC